jgi:2-C-methyl-D-erythritol 4-phosphate cytidylyltransferase
MYRYALIVAGGKGLRMGSDIPKQFMLLNGLPVLMHTLRAFEKHCDELILVLPKEQMDYWGKLCTDFDFKIKHKMVFGGNTRFASVSNGLKSIKQDSLVAIHDGVRPLMSDDLIEQSYITAENDGSAVAAVKLKDTIRSFTTTLDREQFRLVQTPQTFVSSKIIDAYEFASILDSEGKSFTDDASVYEKSGYQITLIEGEYKNIKITTPEDLLIAEALLK